MECCKDPYSNGNAQAPQTCMFNGKDFYFQQHFYHLYFCFNQEITLWIQVHRCILPSKDNICSDLSTIIYWYNEFHKNILQGTTVLKHFSHVNFYAYVMIGVLLQLFFLSSIHTIMQPCLQRLGWRRETHAFINLYS